MKITKQKLFELEKEKEIIETIERARLRLEQSLNFYYKNTKNENIKKHFWANISLEINDVKNELMDLETKLIVFLAKEVQNENN